MCKQFNGNLLIMLLQIMQIEFQKKRTHPAKEGWVNTNK
jgi:hypothetical protein